MSRFKKASFVLLGFLALLIAVFIIVNLGDEELNPQVKARLAPRAPVPPKVLEGFKYSLGLFAPENAEPLRVGGDVYEQMLTRRANASVKLPKDLKVANLKWCWKTSSLCSPDERKFHGDEIRAVLSQHKTLLTRYEHLMTYPGAAGDVEPSMFVRTPLFELYQLAGLQRASWSERLAEKDDASVLAEWKQSNEFYKAKLDRPANLLDASISIQIIESNRGFMEAALREYPRLKPSNELLNSVVIKTPVSTLDEGVIRSELAITHELVQMEPRDGLFNLASATPPKVDFAKLLKLGYRQNQTVNDLNATYDKFLQADCLRADEKCPNPRDFRLSQFIVNPVGNSVVAVMAGLVPYRIRELHRKHEKLSKPFNGSGLFS